VTDCPEHERYKADAIRLVSVNPLNLLEIISSDMPFGGIRTFNASVDIDKVAWSCQAEIKIEIGDHVNVEDVWTRIESFFHRREMVIVVNEQEIKRKVDRWHDMQFSRGKTLKFKVVFKPATDLSLSFLHD
jgi:hypothetical protein